MTIDCGTIEDIAKETATVPYDQVGDSIIPQGTVERLIFTTLFPVWTGASFTGLSIPVVVRAVIRPGMVMSVAWRLQDSEAWHPMNDAELAYRLLPKLRKYKVR